MRSTMERESRVADDRLTRSFSATFYYSHAWGMDAIASICRKAANGQFAFLETNSASKMPGAAALAPYWCARKARDRLYRGSEHPYA